LRGPGPACGPGIAQLRAVPRGTRRAGVPGATDESDRALAAGIGPAAGQEPGAVRHEAAAGEGGAAGAGAPGWGIRGRPGERPGIRAFGEGEDASPLWDRSGADAVGPEGVVRPVQLAGAGSADRPARLAAEPTLEEAIGLRGVADRRPGLRPAES